MDKAEIFYVECVKFAVVAKCCCGNKHIGYAGSMAKGIGFTKLRKEVINWFAQGKQVELANKFYILNKTSLSLLPRRNSFRVMVVMARLLVPRLSHVPMTSPFLRMISIKMLVSKITMSAKARHRPGYQQ